MKLQFSSDLHLEMRPNYHLSVTDADVIVLAGDIHVGIKAIEFAKSEAERQNKPVLVVAGNHEYYHHDYSELLSQFRALADTSPLVHFLENDEVILEGVRFLGSTLWTDYKGDGSDNAQFNMAFIGNALNDHRVIRNTYKAFSPADALAIHQSSRAWLESKLAEPFSGKTVVITHHGPSVLTQHKSYPYGAMSSGFLSNLDVQVEKSDLWIYGHSHSNIDTMLGNCRLVSNQMGYPSEGGNGEQFLSDFKPNWVLTL